MLGDGGSTAWKDMNTTLYNLIAQRRVPPMVSIQIGNGGQDAQGAQRGREYDTVSGTYAQFVEREVLPLVEQNAGVKLTKNPEGRATMGLSSSGTAATSFPLMVNGLLNQLFFKIDVLLLKPLAGDLALGWYSTAYKVIDGLQVIPASFVLSSNTNRAKGAFLSLSRARHIVFLWGGAACIGCSSASICSYSPSLMRMTSVSGLCTAGGLGLGASGVIGIPSVILAEVVGPVVAAVKPRLSELAQGGAATDVPDRALRDRTSDCFCGA